MNQILKRVDKVLCPLLLGIFWVGVIVTIAFILPQSKSAAKDEIAVYRFFIFGIVTFPFVVWLGVMLYSKVKKGRTVLWMINILFLVFLLWFWLRELIS